MNVQLTLEQHGFELVRSVKRKFFFQEICTMILHNPVTGEPENVKLKIGYKSYVQIFHCSLEGDSVSTVTPKLLKGQLWYASADNSFLTCLFFLS